MARIIEDSAVDQCIQNAIVCRQHYQQEMLQALLISRYDRAAECVRMCLAMTHAINELQTMQEQMK